MAPEGARAGSRVLTRAGVAHDRQQLFFKGISFERSVKKVKIQNNLRFVKCSTKQVVTSYVCIIKTNQVGLGYLSWKRYVIRDSRKKITKLFPSV